MDGMWIHRKLLLQVYDCAVLEIMSHSHCWLTLKSNISQSIFLNCREQPQKKKKHNLVA